MARTNKFYVQRQNNVEGFFSNRGDIREYVIIEAVSEKQAGRIATKLGLYSENKYQDYCPCCGLRWYGQWSEHETVDSAINSRGHGTYIVHYRDGSKVTGQ